MKKRGDSGEAGYSIVEVLVGITLLAIVLLAADRGAIGTLSAAALGREHSVATGLVTAAMAEAVALPFADVENGLDPTADSSFSTDHNIVASGVTNCDATPPTSGYVLKLNGVVTPTATSSVPVCNVKTSEAPFVPHVSSVNEGITYTLYTYPTTDTASPGIVTVVVVVTWKAPNGSIQKVVGEDAIAAP
jgi:type II secretory pathway pseudopilin PulG